MCPFLPSKEHDSHHLCVVCHGKSCTLDDHCEEYHDLPDDRCDHVTEYVVKLSVQCERKTKSSSSFISGFSPSMPVPLGQLPSSAVLESLPRLHQCQLCGR